jgi:hypothetical protein
MMSEGPQGTAHFSFRIRLPIIFKFIPGGTHAMVTASQWFQCHRCSKRREVLVLLNVNERFSACPSSPAFAGRQTLLLLQQQMDIHRVSSLSKQVSFPTVLFNRFNAITVASCQQRLNLVLYFLALFSRN